MKRTRRVSEILRKHVTLEVEGIDRMYLNAVVPILQAGGGFNWFFRECRGQRFAAAAMMAPMTRAFVGSIEAYARSSSRRYVSAAARMRTGDTTTSRRSWISTRV